MRALVLLLSLVAVSTLDAQAPSRATAPQTNQTALDRYVAAPDTHFAFTKVGNLPASGGVTATILELT